MPLPLRTRRRATLGRALLGLAAGLGLGTGLGVPAAGAQVYSEGAVVEALPLGARNGVTNMHAEGGRLYAGPRLVISDDGATFRAVASTAFAPPSAPGASVFSIDAEGDTVVVGLGFVDTASAGAPQTAAGFAVSTDGGATWAYRPPPLDRPEATTVRYGVSTLPALPVTVPQQSPPFDVDLDPDTGTLWTAGWASGIRRSDDLGATWERVVLPPDTLAAIDPQTPYDFPYAPERNPSEEANNFLGFSVLVDEAGTVWAGTVAGVNRSDVADIDGATGDRAWRRFFWDETDRGLPGNWIIAIEEQPLGDPAFPAGSPENPRNPVWLAAWPALDPGEQFGVAVWTGDDAEGRPVFETRLLPGGRVYDLAFDGPRVYAAGTAGLALSDDDGATWRTIRTFRGAGDTPLPVAEGAIVYSVAVVRTGAGAALWAGTADGLLKSTDGGATWRLFRVGVPLGPAEGAPDLPTVEAYAYPNPYAPGRDGLCRIRFDLTADAAATVRVFDFGMRPVRTLEAAARAGANEVAWDGLTDDGLRAANGVYFYRVEAGSASASGKILVLE